MATQEPTSVAQHCSTARVLRWRVERADHALQLKAGDVLVYDASKPKDSRVSLERPLPFHAGVLDRLQVVGRIVPLEGTMLDARSALVVSLLHDRDNAEGVAA